MLFLLILFISLPFIPNKSDCSLIANGISEGERSRFLVYFDISQGFIGINDTWKYTEVLMG